MRQFSILLLPSLSILNNNHFKCSFELLNLRRDSPESESFFPFLDLGLGLVLVKNVKLFTFIFQHEEVYVVVQRVQRKHHQ